MSAGPRTPAPVPDPAWRRIGATSNADVYEIAPDILGIVPWQDSTDTEESARESLELQRAHWERAGRRGAVVVFMDRVLAQLEGARAVYASVTRQHPTTCYALVGETFFGYAVSAVFTGLSRPVVPTQVFRTLDEARPWIDATNRERGRSG